MPMRSIQEINKILELTYDDFKVIHASQLMQHISDLNDKEQNTEYRVLYAQINFKLGWFYFCQILQADNIKNRPELVRKIGLAFNFFGKPFDFMIKHYGQDKTFDQSLDQLIYNGIQFYFEYIDLVELPGSKIYQKYLNYLSVISPLLKIESLPNFINQALFAFRYSRQLGFVDLAIEKLTEMVQVYQDSKLIWAIYSAFADEFYKFVNKKFESLLYVPLQVVQRESFLQLKIIAKVLDAQFIDSGSDIIENLKIKDTDDQKLKTLFLKLSEQYFAFVKQYQCQPGLNSDVMSTFQSLILTVLPAAQLMKNIALSRAVTIRELYSLIKLLFIIHKLGSEEAVIMVSEFQSNEISFLVQIDFEMYSSNYEAVLKQIGRFEKSRDGLSFIIDSNKLLLLLLQPEFPEKHTGEEASRPSLNYHTFFAQNYSPEYSEDDDIDDIEACDTQCNTP